MYIIIAISRDISASTTHFFLSSRAGNFANKNDFPCTRAESIGVDSLDDDGGGGGRAAARVITI